MKRILKLIICFLFLSSISQASFLVTADGKYLVTADGKYLVTADHTGGDPEGGNNILRVYLIELDII